MAKEKTPLDYIMFRLKKDNNVSYAAVKEGAEKKGYKIYPIMYGRAKNLLGLAPSKPKKGATTVTATSVAGTDVAPKKKRGRPRKAVAEALAAVEEGGTLLSPDDGTSGNGLELASAIGQIKDIIKENRQLKARLAKIASLASV